jgi:hypothetical protein
VAEIRRIISLCSGLPGTMGIFPLTSGFSASSRMSRRKSMTRALLSGPWQRKQVSDMIGRKGKQRKTGDQPFFHFQKLN